MSPILVMFTSYCNSDFEFSNISLNKNKLDGVDLTVLITEFERTRSQSKKMKEWKETSMVFGRLKVPRVLFIMKFGKAVDKRRYSD